MTVHDLLAWGEYSLREDPEYWSEMDRLKNDIDRLIDRHNKIMAAAMIRLAVSMIAEKHSGSKCTDCVGGSCEDCLEGKDHDKE